MDSKGSIGLKTILIVTLLIAMGHQTHAQSHNVFGTVVGMNVSKVSNYDGRTLVGITAGLSWESKLSDSFSLQSYFLYCQRGERDDNATSKLGLQYINLPIMAKYHVSDKFQVMTGVYWDFLLGVDSQVYSKDDFKNSDFGIPVGLSYVFSDNIQLGLSYNFGLTNISDTNTNNFAPRNNWGNVTIALLIRQSIED